MPSKKCYQYENVSFFFKKQVSAKIPIKLIQGHSRSKIQKKRQNSVKSRLSQKKIDWWQNFYSRWRCFRVIASLKFEKFRRGGMFWWHAIFSGNFFSLFFLHQCINRDHISRNFSIHQFLFCKSVQKMAAKLKFGQKSAIPPNVLAPFFL